MTLCVAIRKYDINYEKIQQLSKYDPRFYLHQPGLH